MFQNSLNRQMNPLNFATLGKSKLDKTRNRNQMPKSKVSLSSLLLILAKKPIFKVTKCIPVRTKMVKSTLIDEEICKNRTEEMAA